MYKGETPHNTSGNGISRASHIQHLGTSRVALCTFVNTQLIVWSGRTSVYLIEFVLLSYFFFISCSLHIMFFFYPCVYVYKKNVILNTVPTNYQCMYNKKNISSNMYNPITPDNIPCQVELNDQSKTIIHEVLKSISGLWMSRGIPNVNEMLTGEIQSTIFFR